jgi:hypothetical protein
MFKEQNTTRTIINGYFVIGLAIYWPPSDQETAISLQV